MAKRRRTRISYAHKPRRKSSASNRTLTTSSINEQEKEQETVKPKSKQKNSRIVYKPKVRRKTSDASTASENVSSNEQEAKELPRRNKRRSSGTLMAANKQQPKKKKENWSSSEENSVQKASTSGQGKEKQKTTPKKGVTQRKKRVEETNKMPKHIKDITIGRKTYAKWRLLNPVTKAFTEQALESAMLNVLNSVGREFKKKEVQVHLKKLSERISSRLDNLKGPPHKEDYRTMEAENRELENAVISCNEQIEVLEKELEEQTRLLEEDTRLLSNYSDQEIQLQWQKELHPLLQKEPVNALKLPCLSDETSKMLFTSQITTSSEKDNKDIVSLVFGKDKRNKLATATG